jgi:RNA polymerase sigma-54 factor
MDAVEYAQALAAEAESNPFLEVELATPPVAQDSAMQPVESWGGPTGLPSAAPEDFDAMAGLAEPLDLRDHLRAQLAPLARDAVLHGWALALVDSLDDDGYLRQDIGELAHALGRHDDEDLQAARTALRWVQNLEPAGVAARDLSECLLLQLRQLPPSNTCTLAQHLVRDHLAALAKGDPGRLARTCGTDDTTLQAALALIRRLRPRPGADFGPAHAQAIIPDVLVRRVKGTWRALANPAAAPRVRVRPDWAILVGHEEPACSSPLGECLQRARWTEHHAQHRAATILQVADAIVQRQQMFFRHGPLLLKPLELSDVAQMLGVHPSTVSRAVNGKFLDAPFGCMEMRRFFSRALGGAGRPDGGVSTSTVKTLILELIAAERNGQALSDAQIAQLLAQQGCGVARRTVTKYRTALRIPPADRRGPA